MTKKQILNVKNQFKILIEQKMLLSKKGGHEKDGVLFEKILTQEEKILRLFNLPPSGDNLTLLDFKYYKRIKDTQIDKRINSLLKRKEEFLNDNRTELEILFDGIKNNLPASIILPKIKISHHSYQIFLYERIKKKQMNFNKIIFIYNEMLRAEKFLNDLGTLQQLYKKLNESGFQYINEFLSDNLLFKFKIMAKNQNNN